MSITQSPPSLPKRYGITEKKKAELDLLTLQVLDAQYNVEQLQASVASLTAKSLKFQGFLTAADNTRTKALSNKNLVDEMLKNALDLKNNSKIAFDKMVLADQRTKEVAGKMKTMIDQLIYSAEVIDKLSNLVIRKKSQNPLISDELVSMITDAGKDANNSIALALVALKSTFAAQSASLESEAAASLEYIQSIKLYEILTGTKPDGTPAIEQKSQDDKTPVDPNDPNGISRMCLTQLIDKANKNAIEGYDAALVANTKTTKELNTVTTDLNKAQVKLKSLQSGLAAANAAALAS